MAELYRLIDFIKKKIAQHERIKEHYKLTVFYHQLLEFTELQIPKKAIKVNSYYSYYKCPICGQRVYDTWNYCCQCSNKLEFDE